MSKPLAIGSSRVFMCTARVVHEGSSAVTGCALPGDTPLVVVGNRHIDERGARLVYRVLVTVARMKRWAIWEM